MEVTMTVRQLPERPNLEQLKRQAKDLLSAARRHDEDALARFRILPAFAGATTEALALRRLALHDAHSVVAREHGFASWNDMRERIEELGVAQDGAIVQLVEAATGNRVARVERLVALHPAIPRASFHAALVLGDAVEVERRLAAAPELATQRGGPRDWEPLHYVCHSALARGSAGRTDGLVAIAKRLVALGADPNLRYPWRHHGVFRPVLWAAVCVAGSLPLAAALLDAGADPSDGVTLPLAASAGDLAALDLLLAHGVDPNRPWASDGAAPLYAILHWSRTIDGAVWLLEHGADPDPVFAGNGESPLHVVAASGELRLAELLLARGADVTRRRADGRSPYAVAALHGREDVAAWLLAHGAAAELSPVDRLVAACSRGDRSAADAILAAEPELRARIGPEHYAPFYAAAERGDMRVLATMLACGFDIDRPDESIGKTVLHIAAAEGRPDVVRMLLDAGASVAVRDREFHGTPLVWAADGARTRPDGRDHAAVAKLLLDAGVPLEWSSGEEPAEAITDIIAEWRGVAPE
jgi:ankyrin repeat protein